MRLTNRNYDLFMFNVSKQLGKVVHGCAQRDEILLACCVPPALHRSF
jgi:hypothetical protein